MDRCKYFRIFKIKYKLWLWLFFLYFLFFENVLFVIVININLVLDKVWCGSEILMVFLFNVDLLFNENIFGIL